MESGIYVSRFRTNLDESDGVIFVQNDEIWGGDSSFYYTGFIGTNERGQLKATVRFRTHTEPEFSVFESSSSDLTIIMTGRFDGEKYRFEGRPERGSNNRFEATLELLERV